MAGGAGLSSSSEVFVLHHRCWEEQSGFHLLLTLTGAGGRGRRPFLSGGQTLHGCSESLIQVTGDNLCISTRNHRNLHCSAALEEYCCCVQSARRNTTKTSIFSIDRLSRNLGKLWLCKYPLWCFLLHLLSGCSNYYWLDVNMSVSSHRDHTDR